MHREGRCRGCCAYQVDGNVRRDRKEAGRGQRQSGGPVCDVDVTAGRGSEGRREQHLSLSISVMLSASSSRGVESPVSRESGDC